MLLRLVDLLALGRCHAEGVNERKASWAREGAHQQWARATPDIAHAAPNVVSVVGRFPRASHVQHPIYF
jgi:hypothetical protein